MLEVWFLSFSGTLTVLFLLDDFLFYHLPAVAVAAVAFFHLTAISLPLQKESFRFLEVLVPLYIPLRFWMMLKCLLL
jgi:hypothetical protein